MGFGPQGSLLGGLQSHRGHHECIPGTFIGIQLPDLQRRSHREPMGRLQQSLLNRNERSDFKTIRSTSNSVRCPIRSDCRHHRLFIHQVSRRKISLGHAKQTTAKQRLNPQRIGSTAEIVGRKRNWPGRRDSNPQPSVPKTDALSVELRPGVDQ